MKEQGVDYTPENEPGLLYVPLQMGSERLKFDTQKLNAIKKKNLAPRSKANRSARMDVSLSESSGSSLEEKPRRKTKKTKKGKGHRRAKSERLGSVDTSTVKWRKMSKGDKLAALEKEKRDIENRIKALEERRKQRMTLSLRGGGRRRDRVMKRGGPIKSGASMVMGDQSLKPSTGMLSQLDDSHLKSSFFDNEESQKDRVFKSFNMLAEGGLLKKKQTTPKSSANIKESFNDFLDAKIKKKKKKRQKSADLEQSALQKESRQISSSEEEPKPKKAKKKPKKKAENIDEVDVPPEIKCIELSDSASYPSHLELSDHAIPKEKAKRKKKKKKPKPPNIIINDVEQIDDLIKNDPKLSEVKGDKKRLKSRRKREKASKRKKKKERDEEEMKGSFYDKEKLKKYRGLIQKKQEEELIVIDNIEEEVARKKKKKETGKRRSKRKKKKQTEELEDWGDWE
jgi:hypothetical protein